MAPDVTEKSSNRLAPLDGLRGIAIILVVLSHGWMLQWPLDEIFTNPWLKPWFKSGNSAVTIFLVASGFLTYRALARGGSLEGMRPGVTFLRRVLRVAPAVWVMMAVILLIASIDPTDDYSQDTNRRNLVRVLTYTWNWFIHDSILDVRDDLGHLWYLSVDMQAFVLMSLLAWMLRRRPLGLPAALAGIWLVLAWWRTYIADREDHLLALLRTTVRMDAFVIGMLAASVIPLAGQLRGHTRGLRIGTGVAFVPLIVWCDDNAAYLSLPGTLLQVNAALFLFALVLSTDQPRRSLLALPGLVWLGRNSLALYIWHVPVIKFMVRHAGDWSWQARTAAALLVVVGICWLSDRLIDRKVSTLLARSGWRRLDDGLVSALSSSVGGAWRSSRAPGAPKRRRG